MEDYTMRSFFSPLRLFIIMSLKQSDNALGKTLTFLFNPMESIPARFRTGSSGCVWFSRLTSDPQSVQRHSSHTWWAWPPSDLQRTGVSDHLPPEHLHNCALFALQCLTLFQSLPPGHSLLSGQSLSSRVALSSVPQVYH